MLVVNIYVKVCIFVACGVLYIYIYIHILMLRTVLHCCYVRCTSAESLLMGWKVQVRQ